MSHEQQRVRRRRIAVAAVLALLLLVVAHFTRSVWISRIAGSVMSSAGNAIITSSHEPTTRSHARNVRLPLWAAWLSVDGSAVYVFHQGRDFVYFPTNYGFPANSGIFYSQDGVRSSSEVMDNARHLNGQFWSGGFNYGLAEPDYF